MTIRRAAMTGALFLSFSVSATDLETVTVSATPINVDEAGSSITVITRETIARRNSTIQALLRDVPGLAVNQQGSIGAITQVRVRGAEANQLLVLINGIEANDLAQGGEFDFSQISLGDVERIEIVRGPQSALWGSDAMAGVVHIITSPGSNESRYSATVEAGSFSSQRATLTGQIASGNNRLKLSADYLDTDGSNISRQGNEKDGLENLTLGLSGRYTPADNFSVDYSARHTDKTADFDGVDFITTGLPIDADNDTRSEYLYGGLKLSHDISGNLDHSLSLATTDSSNATRPGNDVTDGRHDAARYQVNYAKGPHIVSILAEHEKETFKQRGVASFFGDPNQERTVRTDSLAAEYRYLGDGFSLSLSVREDHNSDFDDATSWRATGNYRLGETTLHASVGESIKNPTFVERFGYFTNFIGNTGLMPEQSLQWELGARRSFQSNRLDLALTWFNASLDNEINGFVYEPVSFGFTSANVDGKSHRQGAELSLHYRASDRLSISGSYTYLDATQEDFAGNDIREVRRPQHAGSLTMSYAFENAGMTLAVSRTGKQEDDYFPPFPPFTQRVSLSGYTLIELSGYYEINSNLTLTVRAENLADEQYEQVYGFESPGFGGFLGLRYAW